MATTMQWCDIRISTFLHGATELGNIKLHSKFERPTSFNFIGNREFQSGAQTQVTGRVSHYEFNINYRPMTHNLTTIHECNHQPLT